MTPSHILPVDLSEFCDIRHTASAPLSGDPFESAIVTGFFDLGRGNWSGAAGPSPFQRSLENYFEWFGNLARLKNPLVLFTEPRFAARVLDMRRAHGLEERTSVVAIDGLFEAPPVAAALRAADERMTPRFHEWVLRPDSPEYREPRYVVLTALKSTLASTAVKLGLVRSEQLAWIDFGYCRDQNRFDPSKPWRFDAGGKLNMFNVTQLDDRPVTLIVRLGTSYMQGCHMVGPTAAWAPFAAEMAWAYEALVACGLVDDDQTLMLMAYRRRPEMYRLHSVGPLDWYVIFRRFNCDIPYSAEPAEPAAPVRGGSLPMEELRFATRRLKTRWRRWRKALYLR